MVIELANEVRKVLDEGIPKERKSVHDEGIPKERKSVLEIEGIPKERKLVGPPHIPHNKSHMPTLQLHPLPEAIAMDSS